PASVRIPLPTATVLVSLSLHDALPIFSAGSGSRGYVQNRRGCPQYRGHRNHQPEGNHHRMGQEHRKTGISGVLVPYDGGFPLVGDRKSTRLKSSHVSSSYYGFCLRKKK